MGGAGWVVEREAWRVERGAWNLPPARHPPVVVSQEYFFRPHFCNPLKVWQKSGKLMDYCGKLVTFWNGSGNFLLDGW
jgi:hypothetical protein